MLITNLAEMGGVYIEFWGVPPKKGIGNGDVKWEGFI